MDLKEIFKAQQDDSVRDKFDDEPNHKRFFFEHDGLHNLEEDIVFTVRGRYTCGHGCQVCFLNGHWLDDSVVAQHTPNVLTEAYEAKMLHIFDHFARVDSIDDLRALKRHHPALFDIYRRHAGRMEFHTSDNGFFAEFDILMNDVQFQNIGQLSFSDYLLDKKDGLVDDIIEKLRVLNDRSPISRLNFVITKGNPENDPNVMKLAEWLYKTDNTTAMYFHNDIRVDVDHFSHLRSEGYKQPSAYHIEHSTNPPTKCNVFSETVHLRYEDFFPDLYTSMEENTWPFHDCKKGFNSAKFMVALLQEKLRMYDRNRKIMSVDNKLKQYFDFVADNIVVNEDFTFIPSIMLSPSSHFYQELARCGYTNTYAGLIKNGTDKIVPIAGVKQ